LQGRAARAAAGLQIPAYRGVKTFGAPKIIDATGRQRISGDGRRAPGMLPGGPGMRTMRRTGKKTVHSFSRCLYWFASPKIIHKQVF
jgi:hypothetical protein